MVSCDPPQWVLQRELSHFCPGAPSCDTADCLLLSAGELSQALDWLAAKVQAQYEAIVQEFDLRIPKIL